MISKLIIILPIYILFLYRPCTSTKIISNRKITTLLKKGEDCKNITPTSRCEDGLFCEDGSCKVLNGGECILHDNFCANGTHCVLTRYLTKAGKCVKIPAANGHCLSNYDCQNFMKCENNSCKRNTYHDCYDDNECASGLKCVGTKNFKFKMCIQDEYRKNAGDSCGFNPYNVCKSNLICEDEKCKIKQHGSCSLIPTQFQSMKGDNCVKGLKCVTYKTYWVIRQRQCEIPSSTNGKCKNSTYCTFGRTCEDGICKIKNGFNCLKNQDACAKGLQCFKYLSFKICLKPVPESGYCENSYMSRLHCDEKRNYWCFQNKCFPSYN